MIVDPDFPDHWKTRLLVDLLEGDEAAPMYVIRLWAHCQNRRTHEFEDLSSSALKAICRFAGDPTKFEQAMVSSGFVIRTGKDITVHEWELYTARLIAKWTNGKLGGRPKKPKRNPTETHGIPMANPSITHGEPKTNPSITDKIGLDEIGLDSTPPTPQKSQHSLECEWAAAVDEILAAGVGQAVQACGSARASGCTPQQVLAVLEFWESSKPAWNAGALVRRLEKLRPDQDPTFEDLWPPRSKAAEVARSREDSLRKQTELQEQRARDSKQLADERKRIQDLEQKYGEYLDSNQPRTIRMMVNNMLPKEASLLLASYKNGPPKGLLRESILLEWGRTNFRIPEEAQA